MCVFSAQFNQGLNTMTRIVEIQKRTLTDRKRMQTYSPMGKTSSKFAKDTGVR